MPELLSHRESSTLSADRIPIEGDHPFQAIPTTHSDRAEKVATFRPESVVAFRRNQWSPSRRNRWPPSPGKRRYGKDPAFLRRLAEYGEVFVAEVHRDQQIYLEGICLPPQDSQCGSRRSG